MKNFFNINIEVNVKEEKVINIFLEEKCEINLKIEESINNILPYYEGEYKIIPGIDEKLLETKDKSMKDDVVVLEIPRYQFDNLSNGQTVVIGG